MPEITPTPLFGTFNTGLFQFLRICRGERNELR